MKRDIEKTLNKWGKKYKTNLKIIELENTPFLGVVIEETNKKHHFTPVRKFDKIDEEVLEKYEESGELEKDMINEFLKNKSESYGIHLVLDKMRDENEYILGVHISPEVNTELGIIRPKKNQSTYDALLFYEARGRIQESLWSKFRVDFPDLYDAAKEEWKKSQEYYIEDEKIYISAKS